MLCWKIPQQTHLPLFVVVSQAGVQPSGKKQELGVNDCQAIMPGQILLDLDICVMEGCFC